MNESDARFLEQLKKLYASAFDLTEEAASGEWMFRIYGHFNAEHYLGLPVEERPIYKEELTDMAEAGLCGTAAVICPVGKIVDHGTEIVFPSGMTQMGPVTQKLYDTLTAIQQGRIQAPAGWIHKIPV